jgi:hypothetical protein
VAQPFKIERRKGRPFPIFDLSIQVRLSSCRVVKEDEEEKNLCDFQPCVGVSLVLKQKETRIPSTHTNILPKIFLRKY